MIGLLTSADGIPIAHHVFAGGTQDATTLKGVLDDLTARFAVGRICVVADRGLITDDNIGEVEGAVRLAVRGQAPTPQGRNRGPG